MKGYSLLYHDVVEAGQDDASGFAGGAAGRYKLDWPEFERHVAALEATGRSPVAVQDLDGRGGPPPWLLTFDDGGKSAVAIGERLARLGWPAHFFVTADFLGSPTFVDRDDVRELVRLGHVIGSHSCSHPDHMADDSFDDVLSEWTRSVEILSEVTGAPVRVASVPAGSYAPHVARAASAAGIAHLFNSEPQADAHRVDGCVVLGRYTIRRGSPARTAARIASGAPLPRTAQLVAWRGKRVVRRVAGRRYEHVRRRILR